MQGNALNRGPDDGQATHLRGKHVNLVSPLSNIAEETLDGVGRSDVAVEAIPIVVYRCAAKKAPQCANNTGINPFCLNEVDLEMRYSHINRWLSLPPVVALLASPLAIGARWRGTWKVCPVAL